MTASKITPQLFSFLEDLKKHNDRDWFAEHKTDYETFVRDPAVELIERLVKPLARSAPMLHVVPKSHNGSLMRVYRDTRFSKNKDPYKTNVGISFRHQAGKDVHAPGVYLHLDPDECFLGAGCWRPESSVLAAIRAAIDTDAKAWKRARDQRDFRQHFELAGESLKTSP
ncbi:MAG: TIGR02453 family protein, partial [Planctomycetota bacterium]